MSLNNLIDGVNEELKRKYNNFLRSKNRVDVDNQKLRTSKEDTVNFGKILKQDESYHKTATSEEKLDIEKIIKDCSC